ncbi:peptide-N4-asparagine amidase [Rhodanobacter sp. C05]|uniref:peptide-N4-asparagine amidase n=1 Tax=Rhodanobacter sp. C05 TaxID=1945855 RepID=UPI0009855276|nr:peptide-N4-asparagine amidase [Rhodanobacter sp. C05]OOG43662.1 peptide-N(4)-(N-acetyl-beta-glucosaminyl)asparagine amidase [Rhodanobacter sp. C05]
MLPKRFAGRCLALAGLSLTFACGAFAAPATSSPVGSNNVTVADPSVPRPSGTPCVVQLFQDDTFTDFNTRPYSYTPPSGCGKHWSKVVLEADFSVTAGRQFDRTATLWLGGVNLYFGTTEEPSSTVAPSWHVERDLTDYSTLLSAAGNGQAIIGNVVNSTYTGVIHGSARLLFYPASMLAPAAQVPDAVYPLGSDAVGNTTELDSSTSQLAKTLTLPRNVERAYLDVFVQSQNADEFWYTCVPDQYAAEVQECGGGNFREAEVSIDGQPAGVAPVYPWIYTGGIDPYLWRPTPGVQTLNFMPYRVDLTPFAGVLSNGSPHTVALSVAGADNYFSATASLLVYLDPHAQQVSGQLVRNTLVSQPPTPTIGDTLQQDSSGNITGNITTNLSRHFVIEGYADTSRGRVQTTVDQTVGFADTQGFTINATTYRQVTDQLTSVDGVSRSRIGHTVVGEYREKLSYPLHLDINEQVATDGSFTLATIAHQDYQKHSAHQLFGISVYSAKVGNTVDSADTLDFDASGNLTAHTGQHSTQTFAFHDSLGGCYRADVGTLDGVVSSYDSGQGCPDHRNRVYWFSHPDGSPDNGDIVQAW